MDMNFFKNNPALGNLSPEKLEFLMNFANAGKPTQMKDMAPFLFGTLNNAKKKNIQFSQSETDLLIQILKQNMSPEEAQKADRIIALMNSNKKGG